MISPSHLVAARDTGSAIEVVADVGRFRFTPWGQGIVHVSYWPGAKAGDLPMWGFRERPRDAGTPELTEGNHGWTLSMPGLALRLDAASAECSFRGPDDTELTCLQALQMVPVRLSGEKTFHLYATFSASRGEAYYGLGQHQRDWMDHTHWDVPLWHDYKAEGGEVIAIPFLVTNKGYGIAWDNPSRSSVFPGGNGRTSWWSEVGEAVSFFLIAGECADDIYRGYRSLTGPTPLPPLKALGYIQCKQRYKTRDELTAVAETYREKKLPCDLLVVDWFHWKTLGDMDLDPESWPDPEEMNRHLREHGYDVMISCWPRFVREANHWNHLKQNGWFMKDADGETLYGTPFDQRGALLDTTNPDAARWFWDTIQSSYGQRGFSSWWVDEDEPDICPHAYYLNAGTGARIHNIYPLTHTRAIYEGHRRDRQDRCLTLSRSAYHGAQQYGTTFWSSDIHPTWDVFRRQIPCGLNFCASGFAYWSSDIGGWHGVPQQQLEDDSYKSLLIETGEAQSLADQPFNYIELYIRWFQYGAFCPTFRAHGSRPENEVWSFGEEAETILSKYLKLRYRLMPYIYSLAWDTHRSGRPFMRALFMDFPNDPNVRDEKYEYMFGPAFLVAPVYEPGKTTRDVYLPAGAEWVDFWTGQRHCGGQTIRVPAPLDTLPLFLRAGSLVPTGEVVDHLGIPQKDLQVLVAEGANAEFRLYRDDGRTYAYETGDYTLTHLSWNDATQTLAVANDPEGLFDRPQGDLLKRYA